MSGQYNVTGMSARTQFLRIHGAMIRDMTTQSTSSRTDDKRKLGILLCGDSPEKIIDRYGRYDGLFKTLLGPDAFHYKTYSVIDGDIPASIQAADAWLITGSRHGAYDPLPWIAPLEAFIRQAFAANMPMVGICFGHQIMAQALGGKVAKFDGGWITGTRRYHLDTQIGIDSAVLNAWHQDQVLELPDSARALGFSDHCRYAAIGYGDHSVSLQPHPEFENDYVELLLEERGSVLPPEVREAAKASLGQELNNRPIAQWLHGVLAGSA